MRNPLLRAPAAGQDHAPRPAAGQHGDKASQPGARGFGAFLRLGTLGFGGPSAVMGYMQRDLVQQRGWIARQDFLDGVALGQTMPGPLAAQVAMWGGVPAARRGRSGGPPRRRSSS